MVAAVVFLSCLPGDPPGPVEHQQAPSTQLGQRKRKSGKGREQARPARFDPIHWINFVRRYITTNSDQHPSYLPKKKHPNHGLVNPVIKCIRVVIYSTGI